MRPVIKKQKVAVFYPQGFLDGNNALELITIPDLQAVRNSHAVMVLVSMKKVIFFNKNAITVLIEAMEKLHKDLKATIGFCDYDKKQFYAFFKYFKNDIPFSLFENLDVAMIFAGVHPNASEEKNVLIYNEDSTQRSLQAIEIYDKGFNPIVTQTQEEFDKRKADSDKFLATSSITHIGLMGNRIAAKTRGNCVIYFLKGFLDGAIAEQFDIAYHQNCLKVGFQLFMFDATRVSSLNIHAANFFSKLSTAGAEYGALIAIVGLELKKTPKAFIEELEDAGIMFFESEADFLQDETVQSLNGGGAMVKKDHGKLTRKVIAQLPLLIDATLETLEMMTGMQAIKESVNIQKIDPKEKGDLMASSIAFYGDLDGMISLIMPKPLVVKACTLLIGEESQEEEVLIDALSELVNIIGGKSKTTLQEHHIMINITLPRSYGHASELVDVVGEKQGVQVDFTFEQYPFIFYLSP